MYNGENFLRDAIDSALAQTYPHCEVLVVNDGSTDSTEAIMAGYGSRIRVFSTPNCGVHSALNLGVQNMRGEYFAWLSHDDMFTPDKTEKQIRFLAKQPDACRVIFSDYILMNPAGKDYSSVRHDRAQAARSSLSPIFWQMLNGCTMLIPKQALEEVGLFRNLRYTQDYDMWFRLVRNYPMVHLPELVCRSRQHPEQGTHSEESVSEANALWLRLMSSLTREDILGMAPNEYDFFTRLGELFSNNGLREAATWAWERVPRSRYYIYACSPKTVLRKTVGAIGLLPYARAAKRTLFIRGDMRDFLAEARCIWVATQRLAVKPGLWGGEPRRPRGILRFALPFRTLLRDFRQNPRQAVQRLRVYAEKMRCQRELVQNSIPLAQMERASHDMDSACLIIDHDSGGGSALFREQLVQKKTTSGDHGLTLQYLNAVGVYALQVWNGPVIVCLDLAPILSFLKKLNLKQIILNNIVGYPEPYAVLDGIRGLATGGGRLDIWLHDFYPACPSYHLINGGHDFCGVPQDLAECARCLPSNPNVGAFRHVRLARWRKEWRMLLEAADCLLTSDQSVVDTFLRVFPDLSEAITVQKPTNAYSWKPLPVPPPDSPMVIGVPGTITGPKGARLVEGLAALLQERSGAGKIVVIGRLESNLRSPALHVHGPYAREDLPMLMHKYRVTVGLIPSICAETYCYAADELMALGLPLVCLDRGAQGAKARNYEKGTAVKDANPEVCLAALHESHARFVLGKR